MDRIDFSRGTLWGIAPDRFEVLLHNYRDFEANHELTVQAAAWKPKAKDGPEYNIVDGAAVISMRGTVTNRDSFFSWLYGGAHIGRLSTEIDAALADSRVHGIVLDVDSPGGTIGGVESFSAKIRQASRQKPIVAFTGGMMCSAAYWIGSAANKIVASKTADIGSIGVYMIHTDFSKWDEKIGIKTTIIKSGKYKALGNEFEPLSDTAKKEFQGQLDYIYDLFVDTVAKNRGVKAEEVAEKMADGRVFIGQQAVDIGLADTIGSIEDAIAMATDGHLSTIISTRAAGPSADKETNTMSIKTVEDLKAAYPDLAKQIADTARESVDVAAAREEGVQAERSRVVEILGADADPGAARTAIENGTPAAEAYKEFFVAEKAKRANGLRELEEEATASQGQDPDAESAADKKGMPADKQLSMEASAMAKEKGIPIAEAMTQVLASNPDLNARYKALTAV